MKRQELRDQVRTQTDLDVEDLPDSLVDSYLREGFYRTAALERRWPTFEESWSVTATDGVATVPTDLAEFAAVVVGGRRLTYGDHDWAEIALSNFGSKPYYFSVWGASLYLWPAATGDVTVTLRGWRKPSTDWLTDAAQEADLDERLHLPISHYAASLAYAQLEDPEMENVYMMRWSQQAREIRDDIMESSSYAPLILNGGADQEVAGFRFGWFEFV